jgi:eukaryotic-like serine/threonine-protein kinase
VKGEQDIFCAALERTTEAERSAFLDAACSGAPEVRARVEALLRAAEAAGEFLADNDAAIPERTGSRIDRYRLGERIGQGGFGIVYRAEQEQPVRRTVALKIIKLGMDTRAVVARFEAERQALAMMDHPHIARVFDGGATDAGRPYFVMELVTGVPITTFCNEHRLRVRERLELFGQVCSAVHHAHQKGIIHRDLKPSNILVTLAEGRPVAKVIDFGIAKATGERLTDHTLLTRHHVFLGTPAYMSPEQVGLGSQDVDTRSDIYSLGALLYELLCDAPVLDAASLLAAGYAEVQRAILQRDPPPPSQRLAALPAEAKLAAAARRRGTPERLVTELRGDLDGIVLKCLEKDRSRRYETTEDLARDITSYLQDEPVQARRPTFAYRTTKFVRRHRMGVLASAAALAVLTGSGLFHTHRLAAERDRAHAEARKAAKVSELLTDMLVAGDPFRTPTADGVLEASAARVREEFAEQPDVRAEILSAVGRMHLRRGEHTQARPVLMEAMEAGRQIGRPDLRLAQTLCDLGVLHREAGDMAGAERLLEEALALRRQLRGNDHNDVAITLVELGRVHNRIERFDLAEALFREALEIRRRVLGEEHREVAVSLGDLAVLLWQKGDLAAAESFFAESIPMHRRTVGPDHPNVGLSLANLAQLRIDQGELATAESLLQDAVAIFQQSFGKTHWRTARIAAQLGTVYRKQRRFDEAAAILDEALSHAQSALGPEQPVVAWLSVERAQVHLDCGEAAPAEPLLREALRVQRLTFPDASWRIATTKSLLGAALMDLGRLAEAEPLLIEASQQLKDIAGLQGRETKATRERLATLARTRSPLVVNAE